MLRQNVRYYFLWSARSTHAEEAQEVPNTMIVAMLCSRHSAYSLRLVPVGWHRRYAHCPCVYQYPSRHCRQRNSLVPGTFHTRVTPSLLLLLLLRCLCCLAFTGCGVVRAAQRSSHRRCLGMRLRLGKCDGPVGNGVMQPLRVVFCALFRLRHSSTLR